MTLAINPRIYPHDSLTLLEILISSFARHLDIEELEADYLCSIPALIPAHATALYFFKPAELKPYHIAAHGVDKDFLSYYETYGRGLDPLRQWITKNCRPNQSHLLLGLNGWRHHPVYQIVGEADIDFAMQSPIMVGADIIGTLNFGRTVSEGEFSEQDLTTISIVTQFLGMAILNILGGLDLNRQERFCRMMSQITQGIVIVDRADSVQYANRAAWDLAERFAGDEQPDEQLSQLIQATATERDPQNRISARHYPIPGMELPCTLVLLDEPAPDALVSWLEGVLTPREIEVFIQVEKGQKNRDIASRLCISINTVKRHLDNIYCKLDVNSRTELVAKVYRSMQRDGNEL